MLGPRLAALLAVLGFVAPVGAQDSDDSATTATARALFDEGLAFADHGQWEQAVDRFRRTLSLRDSHVVRYNLALGLTHTGALVEASEHLTRLVNDAEAGQDVRAQAEVALDDVRPRIPRLTIRLTGAADGAQVRMDERELPAAMIGVPMLTDPGPHSIAVTRDGREAVGREVDLIEGAREELEIEVPLPGLEDPTTFVLPPDEPTPHEDDAPLYTRWWLWTAVGAVVVTTVILAVVLSGGGAARVQGDLEPPELVFE